MKHLLHAQFRAQAQRTPERVALREGGNEITYAGLLTAATGIAEGLRRRGIGAGAAVGLHMERSIDSVAATLGILMADAAVVPLPPSYPETRLRDILAFAELAAVVDRERDPLPANITAPVLHLAELSVLDASPGAGTVQDSGEADQPAFILTSSGSTGRPKLIVRSHRSFFHRLQWTWNTHPYEEGEVCCQKSYLTTTHAVYELFEPLLRGVPVVIVADQELRDLAGFWQTLRERAVTRLLIVPSLLQVSLELPEFAAPPLRVLVLMGEYVHPRLAAKVLAAFPDTPALWSIYGSTEASSTLACDLRQAALHPGEELPLGIPIGDDVRAFVLDAQRTPVHAGETGVLWIAGSPLFSGYYKDDELTASVLHDVVAAGGSAYDTRDQVRLLPSGELSFIGRVDDTVKVRGFRVDLQEVEQALLRHAGIEQAAVVARAGGEGTATLAAFFAPAAVPQATVFDELRRRLPAYMVPSLLIGLERLPLLSNGKVDRQALLERAASPQAGNTRAGREPTPTEARISEIWRSVLDNPDIRYDSSIFEVGGTSLSVFAALHRIREAFDLDPSVLGDQVVYQFPSVEGLAARIDGIKSGTLAPPPADENPVAVRLRRGTPDREPLFLVAPAGGTLGPYQKLVKELQTTRELVGLRDPFLWGQRDPTLGFARWAGLYVDAMRARQPHGPYFICAYSSAAVFGYEAARSLRRAGQEVAALILIDPLATDRASNRRFGHWAFEARVSRPFLKPFVLLASRLRGRAHTGAEKDDALSQAEFEKLATRAKRSRYHIYGFSGLMELNTGLPTSLTKEQMDAAAPESYLGLLLDKVKSVSPEIDADTLTNMVVQYYLQTRAQHRYELQPYDGKVLLIEPDGSHRGLFTALFGPFVADLTTVAVPLGSPDPQTAKIASMFDPNIRSHYLGMRDAAFIRGAAAAIDEAI